MKKTPPFKVGDRVKVTLSKLYANLFLDDVHVIAEVVADGSYQGGYKVRVEGQTAWFMPRRFDLVKAATPSPASALRAEAKALRKKAKRLDKAAALVEEVSK